MGKIVDLKGKSMTPGIPCIYHLTVGVALYSETAREDGDSFIFDADKTLLVTIPQQAGKDGKMNVNYSKMTGWIFSPSLVRVQKTHVNMITDCGQPELIKQFQAALSGLVAPGSIN
jgi:hypothetical protein